MTNSAALSRRLPRWLTDLTSGDTELPPRTRTATEAKFFLSPESPVSSEKSAFPGRIIIPSSLSVARTAPSLSALLILF